MTATLSFIINSTFTFYLVNTLSWHSWNTLYVQLFFSTVIKMFHLSVKRARKIKCCNVTTSNENNAQYNGVHNSTPLLPLIKLSCGKCLYDYGSLFWRITNICPVCLERGCWGKVITPERNAHQVIPHFKGYDQIKRTGVFWDI